MCIHIYIGHVMFLPFLCCYAAPDVSFVQRVPAAMYTFLSALLPICCETSKMCLGCNTACFVSLFSSPASALHRPCVPSAHQRLEFRKT